MRVAVFSDTHGYTRAMVDAVRQAGPDAVVHLGDHDRDASVLLSRFPELPLYRVCGNCDFNPLAPLTMTVDFGPVRAFLTHGHMYSLGYGSVDRLVYAAQEAGAQLALFGHTHTPFHEDIGGVKILNPGTAGKGKSLTWALLEIHDNGGIAAEIRPLPRP